MTQEHSEVEKEAVKPVFGASGRKIVYDKDGKPYVSNMIQSQSPKTRY